MACHRFTFFGAAAVILALGITYWLISIKDPAIKFRDS